MPLGGLYGVVVGYLVGAHALRRAGSAMEIVSMLNYALPGTIVGIAYLIAFNEPPLALTGTAHDHHRLLCLPLQPDRHPHHGRAAAADRPQHRGGVASLGAGSVTTFRRVMLPLILPAFFAGLGVVFIRSMTAISATIFLVSINWTLITVRILENMTEVVARAGRGVLGVRDRRRRASVTEPAEPRCCAG